MLMILMFEYLILGLLKSSFQKNFKSTYFNLNEIFS